MRNADADGEAAESIIIRHIANMKKEMCKQIILILWQFKEILFAVSSPDEKQVTRKYVSLKLKTFSKTSPNPVLIESNSNQYSLVIFITSVTIESIGSFLSGFVFYRGYWRI